MDTDTFCLFLELHPLDLASAKAVPSARKQKERKYYITDKNI